MMQWLFLAPDAKLVVSFVVVAAGDSDDVPKFVRPSVWQWAWWRHVSGFSFPPRPGAVIYQPREGVEAWVC